MQDRLFIRHPEKWNDCFSGSHQLKDCAGEQIVKNGIILPLVPIPETELPYPVLDIVCRGGVCDESLTFISGHQRAVERTPISLDCWGSYYVGENEIETRHERVVFGGLLYHHLGHTITDTFTRLWHLVKHPDFEKVVFLEFPCEFASNFDPMLLIELIGFPMSKIEIIDRPTKFDEITIPDEAFVSASGNMPEFKLPFQKIGDNVGDSSIKKLYLSRRAYQENPDTRHNPRQIINEEYYEQFFARRGFEIVYPEKLPIAEQIRIVRGADEIVATIGTLTHFLLFAKEDVKATILVRETPMFIQSNIDEACGLKPYYVDASSNPLPVDHAHGPYLMVPNRFFRQYLDKTGVDYNDGELDISDHRDDLIITFLRSWAEVYREPHATEHHVASETMFDVIRRMNDTLFDDTFDENAYRDADRLHDADKICDAALHELVAMKESTSWKLTKPVRAVKDLLVSLRG